MGILQEVGFEAHTAHELFKVEYFLFNCVDGVFILLFKHRCIYSVPILNAMCSAAGIYRTLFGYFNHIDNYH